ncbi:MAG TPA: hypothetical protein VK968_08805 [Roseimicrobium sp.]|nr:hypothetical protein [Roseimicrobium sp.]
MNQTRLNSMPVRIIGLLLLVLLTIPASAEKLLQKGDEVIVIFFDGRECTGVIDEVYVYGGALGTNYSIKYECSDGEKNRGSFPSTKVRLQNAAKAVPAPQQSEKPQLPPAKSAQNKTAQAPTAAATTPVSIADLDFFFGKWKLSKYGGGSTVERDGKIYRETLLYIAKAEPIVINADGTYSWKVRDGSLRKGTWRRLKPDEDNLAGGRNGLVLLKGFDNVDWRVHFMGAAKGKESIKIHSELGNFDGERIGSDKGDPAWNRVQFAAGDRVFVSPPGGVECEGVVDKVVRDYTGMVTYSVYFTCAGDSKTSGAFPAHKMRRR